MCSARRFFETAVGDFEKVLALQPYLESLPPHPKGELLAALAEGWSRLGELQKSQLYLTRMVVELPNTPLPWLSHQVKAPSPTILHGE